MKRILGFLGWLGVALVVAAVAIRFARPAQQTLYQSLAIAGLVATLLYTLSQWRDIARSFQGRNVRYGSIAAGSIVLFLGILVGLNWISNRQNKRWDLTTNKQFSLSDQTRKILGELQKPVLIKVFHGTDGRAQIEDRLDEYAYLSKQVKLEYFDVDKAPMAAKPFEITQYGTLIFEYDGRTERATATDEQSLTNALIKVIEGKAKKIYFVQGHGEHDTVSSDQRMGYSEVAKALVNDNFEVVKLVLAQEGQVPADATVVVIAGPRTDYFAPELDALRAHLRKAGKILMLLDPPDRGESAPLTGLLALAKEWNIDVGTDLVVDASGVGRAIGAGPEVPLAMPSGGHPITEGFQLMTAFPLTRSVTVAEGGAEGRTPQKFLETSPKSWAEADLKTLFAATRPQLALNPDKGDKPGPVSIAVAVSGAAPEAPAPTEPDAPKPETRMVVVGDSDFAANGALGIQGNRELFLNIASWLAQQENLIAIRPKDPDDRRIQLTEAESQGIVWLSLAIIPLLLLGNAVRVYWKRR